ncbi:MAG: protoheme IX farnesyltransferase [Deltaproteobacteria bacterium]|nr:protoheme IX farnesyltransferase [Deltaproteobacteria bacterium]
MPSSAAASVRNSLHSLVHGSAHGSIHNYVDLTKPRLLPLVLFSGLPVMGMTASEWPTLGLACAILLGISLAAASANTLNAYIERDKDARMERTRSRPLPSGRITPRAALIFGVALAAAATVLLYAVGGPAAAGLGVASILFYVFVYTLWAKPRSAGNVWVGGAAGAVSPLIADAALNGSVGAAGLSVFAIIFFWQPPHVWAIALYRKADYEAAGIPMLPSVVGDERTRWWMLASTLALVPVTLAPFALGLVGATYAVVAGLANAWFLWHAVRVIRERDDESARAMFRASLGYLFALLAAMILDVALA